MPLGLSLSLPLKNGRIKPLNRYRLGTSYPSLVLDFERKFTWLADAHSDPKTGTATSNVTDWSSMLSVTRAAEAFHASSTGPDIGSAVVNGGGISSAASNTALVTDEGLAIQSGATFLCASTHDNGDASTWNRTGEGGAFIIDEDQGDLGPMAGTKMRSAHNYRYVEFDAAEPGVDTIPADTDLVLTLICGYDFVNDVSGTATIGGNPVDQNCGRFQFMGSTDGVAFSTLYVNNIGMGRLGNLGADSSTAPTNPFGADQTLSFSFVGTGGTDHRPVGGNFKDASYLGQFGDIHVVRHDVHIKTHAANAAGLRIRFIPAQLLSDTSDTRSGCYVYGLFVAQGATTKPTVFMRTASAGTNAVLPADNIQIQSGIQSQYLPNSFSAVVKAENTGSGYMLHMRDSADTGEEIVLKQTSSTARGAVINDGGGGAEMDESLTGSSASDVSVSLRVAVDDGEFRTTGSNDPATDTSIAAVPADIDEVFIGSNDAGGNYLDGHVKQIRIYPAALTSRWLAIGAANTVPRPWIFTHPYYQNAATGSPIAFVGVPDRNNDTPTLSSNSYFEIIAGVIRTTATPTVGEHNLTLTLDGFEYPISLMVSATRTTYDQRPNTNGLVGINGGWPADYESMRYTIDIMKQSAAYADTFHTMPNTAPDSGNKYGKLQYADTVSGVDYDFLLGWRQHFDSNMWPTDIPDDAWNGGEAAENTYKIVVWPDLTDYSPGSIDYRIYVPAGAGTWEFDAAVTSQYPAASDYVQSSLAGSYGTISVDHDAATVLAIRPRVEDETNTFPNIAVVRADYATEYEAGEVFSPYYKGRAIQANNCFRFMDTAFTNSSVITSFAQWNQHYNARTWVQEPNYFENWGMPLGRMVDLVIEARIPYPWFCMPHRMPEAEMQLAVQYVYDRLKDYGWLGYILWEYSNEWWNSAAAFQQFFDLNDTPSTNISDMTTDYDHLANPYARKAGWKTAQMAKHVKNICGSKGRVIIGGQQAQLTTTAGQAIEGFEHGMQEFGMSGSLTDWADYITTTGYFGANLGTYETEISADITAVGETAALVRYADHRLAGNDSDLEAADLPAFVDFDGTDGFPKVWQGVIDEIEAFGLKPIVYEAQHHITYSGSDADMLSFRNAIYDHPGTCCATYRMIAEHAVRNDVDHLAIYVAFGDTGWGVEKWDEPTNMADAVYGAAHATTTTLGTT